MEIYGVSTIPITVGLVELAKRSGLPGRWAPLCALPIGIGLNFLAMSQPGFEPRRAVIYGIVAALSAVGLWSGTKNTIEGLKAL